MVRGMQADAADEGLEGLEDLILRTTESSGVPLVVGDRTVLDNIATIVRPVLDAAQSSRRRSGGARR